MVAANMQVVIMIALLGVLVATLLSPAFLVHGTRGASCNLVPLLCTPNVKGRCHNDFELTRKVFEENFAKRGETGAAVAVYFRGELVVDLWGGDWGQFRKAPLRSTAGINKILIAMFREEGLVDLDSPVVDLLPGHNQHIHQELTLGHVLTEQFTFEVQTKDNSLRASSSKVKSVSRWVLRPRNSTELLTSKFNYFPYIVDAVLADVIPNIDPQKRHLPQLFNEKIAPLLQPDLGDSISFDSATIVPDHQPANRLAVLIRILTDNTTDSWAGPFPTRQLWKNLMFGEQIGFEEYLNHQSNPVREMLGLEHDVPKVEVTAKGLSRLYSAIASGDPGSKNDMGYKRNHGFYKTRQTTDCIALKQPNLEGLDAINRNATKSNCGFITTSEDENLFSLKEAQTHGRRWMHFAWSNFGGSYAAASVGHGISVAYLTTREGPYDKDPRVKNIIEAVKETVYWKELEEFTADLKKRGITAVKNDDEPMPELGGD
eukprot:TRINITY_DN13564_c0_g1_i1.p1 TRINITY_DN13564_c0_g1~~TRINITY_DN13564_c0_g1_i1.p1  ORF type:complete len:501 (+),score=70.96 TRINITY_DN13564_c0_g1_i1:43-1503(+)